MRMRVKNVVPEAACTSVLENDKRRICVCRKKYEVIHLAELECVAGTQVTMAEHARL